MANRRYSSGRKRSPLLFGITFRLILIVAAAAMFLSYLAVYINPSKFSLPLFFGLFFIPILAINILLLLLALLRRSASAWITVVALLPALLFSDLFYKFGSSKEIEREGIELKIASYNVGMFSASTNKMERDNCRNKIRELLSHHKPQIVCLQEFFADNHTQADTLFGEYPYRHYHMFKARNGKLFGSMILSEFPIESSGVISFPNSTNLSIFADIEHFGRVLRIYNNHLESYNISFTSLAQKFSQKDHLNREEITHDLVETHDKMKDTFIKRSEQVNRIIESINKSALPAIICGDFNDTPMSYTYYTLSKERKDSFEEAGKGFGGTFLPVWPLLRIDYILFPDEFECSEHTIHKIEYSDHYPITSTLII